jgi:hypothetical protein
LQISDILGRTIWQQQRTLPIGEYEENLSLNASLNEGLYFFTIQDVNKNVLFQQKIIHIK